MAAVIGVAHELFGGAFVAPSDRQALPFGLGHTFVDDFLVELGIGGEGDVLFLYRGVHAHIGILTVPAVAVDGVPEYLLNPVLPAALAGVDLVAGRTGLPPLLVLLPPEILEVGVHLPGFLQ